MDHISICICTFKRKRMLERLLVQLQKLKTGNEFTYSIIVADNDERRSAYETVKSINCKSNIHIKYVVEPKQNIALARNKAVENTVGNFVAFIDDDEIPQPQWLIKHYKRLENKKWTGSLGPVRPIYPESCPAWVIRGGFHKRSEPSDKTELTWEQCRTGNVLIRREVFKNPSYCFDSDYGSGREDRDLFKRLIHVGYGFVWN